ncbi:dual specificity protein phosphatase 16 / mitogen-activated protein kinase phosphatase 7 [Acanthocystis turfacea Chlorella virus MN0810.1]|nr:dual specificity protein phosphatase 16 / mitogen-activated protein kinase phosphatase 7 [Acanthocystis turfacea Chlorella virus MN0810.1]
MTSVNRNQNFILFQGELYYKPKRITNHVWVGSRATAADPVFLKKNDIKFIVNCSKDIPKYTDIPMLRVPVNDSAQDAEKMGKFLKMAALAIRDVTRYNGNVLVHCYAGMNRSATVTAAYLMTIKGLTAQQAIDIIKKKKPETFTPMNFRPALKSYEETLKKNGVIGKKPATKTVNKTVNKTAKKEPFRNAKKNTVVKKKR